MFTLLASTLIICCDPALLLPLDASAGGGEVQWWEWDRRDAWPASTQGWLLSCHPVTGTQCFPRQASFDRFVWLGRDPVMETHWGAWISSPGEQSFQGSFVYRSSLESRQSLPQYPLGRLGEAEEHTFKVFYWFQSTADAWKAWTNGLFTSEFSILEKAQGSRRGRLEAGCLSKEGQLGFQIQTKGPGTHSAMATGPLGCPPHSTFFGWRKIKETNSARERLVHWDSAAAVCGFWLIWQLLLNGFSLPSWSFTFKASLAWEGD